MVMPSGDEPSPCSPLKNEEGGKNSACGFEGTLFKVVSRETKRNTMLGPFEPLAPKPNINAEQLQPAPQRMAPGAIDQAKFN